MDDPDFDFDAAIVGAGSAGFAAALMLGKAGRRTVLIEGGEEIGGLCILRGCMPTKTLLHVSEILHQIQHASVLGLQPGEVSFDFPAIIARKNRIISEFAEYRRGQIQTGPFQFVRAWARFVDPHTLELSDGQLVRARAMVLATGSTVAPPPLRDIETVGYLTSDDALALSRLPKSLIVLGGGAVGVEFAQFFTRLGVEVTLVQRSPHILHEFDADAAAVLEEVFRREGTRVFTGTALLRASRRGSVKEIVFESDGREVSVVAEELFFALGRIPHTANLGLEAAGVRTEGRRIVTGADMRTSAPHIYAAGDCRGRHEIVHLAIMQAEIAAHNILHPEQAREIDYRLLTSLIFTSPQIAQVGLTEKEAVREGRAYLSAKYPFGDHGKSILMEERDGFVKLLADPNTGEILGGTVVGPVGGELIHEVIVAMATRMTVQQFAVVPHYHPTLSEIWTYPAEELAAQISK